MRRMMIAVDDATFARVRAEANAERRAVKDQAAIYLERALKHWPAEAPRPIDPRPEQPAA